MTVVCRSINPFAGYINSPESVDRGYITREEIHTMMNTEMPDKTHELVRDLFIFSTFTGLAYSDVKNLTEDNLQTFFDGNLWIITRRKKTNTESNIRLLDVPRKIIEKYKGMTRDNKVFPMPSNSTCNKKLKAIAELCGIKAHLTYHVARHIVSSYLLKIKDLPRLSAWWVTIWKPAGFYILQCSALIKRTLLSSAKVVFFFLITKVISLKNRENRTSQQNSSYLFISRWIYHRKLIDLSLSFG